MEIKYYRKMVYGADLNYLVPSEHADVINYLNGQKTIQDWQIKCFEKLGIKFVEVLAPRK